MAQNSVNSQEKFSSNDWDELCRSPLAVFGLIAMADEEADQIEFDAFLKATHIFECFELEFVNSVYNSSAIRCNELGVSLNDFESMARPLKAVRAILNNKIDPDIADQFCWSLLHTGVQVAKASGGFMGFGKISKDEKEMLITISMVLGIEEDLEGFINP